MKKRNLFLALIGSLVFAGCKDETEIIVVNDEEAQEVWFEDVATNVRVVPLVSEEPIGSIRNMICYGNEIIALDNDKKTVYYFDNGTLVSKMNHEGRGRGEYVDIKRYAYSPSKKVLYVVADDKILWYSVPGMRYCGNTPISYTMNFLTMHDDDHFFGVICKDQRFLAALIDIETGEITKEIEEISMYNHEESNISMSSYSKERHYYSKSDFNNTIVTVKPDNETKVLLKYNFGEKSIPEKYLDFDLKNPMNFGKLFEYMASGRPILCIGPEDGDSARILAETRTGVTVGFDDKTRMKEVLNGLYQRYSDGNLQNSPVGIEKFSRKALAKDYAELLNGLNV